MAYENFMCNKDFHPSNIRNLRKMYEAEQRQKQEEKRQEELRQQYLKEQEVYKSKELIGKANPLNFMYEPPPGLAKDGKGAASHDSKLEEEPKLKFEWQKTGRSAPREEYAKDMELRDKPFGIEVRNVKCIKCGKWGHINTDRECPLFGKAKPLPADGATPLPTPLPDLDTMEDGLIFKQCVRDRIVDDRADNQQIIVSDDETQIGELLSGLSKKERKRVLRKLTKSGGVDGKSASKKEKRRHSKKHRKMKKWKSKKAKVESSSSESETESESDYDRERKQKHRDDHNRADYRHDKQSSREISLERKGDTTKLKHHDSSCMYERGRTHHGKDRHTGRMKHFTKRQSSSEDEHDMHSSRSKNKHRTT